MRILKKLAISLLVLIVLLAIVGWWVTRGVPATLTLDQVTGTDPVLAEPDPQLIPTVGVATPIGWPDGAAPEAAEGLKVNRFAEGLNHPRVIYTMPNGDVIVAQSNAPERVVAGGNPITNAIAGFLFRKAGAAVPSPNNLILLRDADGDGVAEVKREIRSGLSSPSGIAWRDGKLYVANHDALLRFDYAEGADAVTGDPVKLMDLPAAGNHWMRNIVLNDEGTKLFVAVGSASNIGEGGMDIEEGRAAIHELDLVTGKTRIFATGLRNPNGLAWNPWSGELWVTVNERDQLGSDLVPDYLTNVPVGATYGWPWLYWGENVDDRVDAPMPNFLVEYSRTPEFALGPHVAALGLTFTREGARMGDAFNQGAFIARHGSWNRKPPAGYDVVFVRFDERGNPVGKSVQVLKSFLAGKGETHGRPTWVAWDKTGGLLVSDDTGNIIWRVISPTATPAGAPKRLQVPHMPPQRELTGDPSRAFQQPPPDILPGGN
ncbi:sorbosone dehydrogenase family protein [Croceibacterium sp. LX-88]|uniref:Sorbosone dehydrogenase family protein n=1 Tax=Croceibacterium selenioxidans TaxID=2838833 RepID=A0ABS5W6X9_9SPHN|nr:sorbosone dehydrogenase family protein [Croceibacterium selenioxidans]MBT2135256.1 sorbosone dehydrogenase family protein [Croceibacterium selenioxidans]